MTHRHLAYAACACLALAGASLAIAHEPVYDAWAWLVWGRELAGFGLDTSSGPSWKPLAVAVTAVLSVAGDAAPTLWLVVVRASWLFALVLAGAIAYRLTPGLDRRLRVVAAGFAALSLLLLADDFTMWTRQGAAGMSEPLLVALVLGAVVAALERRPRVALACAVLAALLRPEAWPLLGLYGVWLWRAEPLMRAAIAVATVAVPALWVLPDLLASGGGVASAGERAQRGGGAPLHELLEVVARAAVMPLLVVWPLAVAALVLPAASAGGSGAKREHTSRFAPHPLATAVLVLAAGALAWIAVVALMAAAGFPGLPRFMAPAIAIAGVLAGAGLARLLALAPRPRGLAAVAIAVLALTVAQLPGRAEEIPHALSSTARIAHSHDRLRELVRSVGREPLLRCGKLATSDVLVRTALAWELRVPLGDVVSFGAPPTNSGAFVVGPEATAAASARLRTRAELLGSSGEWRAYSLGCSPTAAASSSRSSGVSGARR